MPCPSALLTAANWSGALRRHLAANPEFEIWLENACRTPLEPGRIARWHDEIKAARRLSHPAEADTPAALKNSLRLLRQRVFYVLMVRDIGGLASLDEVSRAMSALADFAVVCSYQQVATGLAALHGQPIDPETGLPQELLLIAMGKLGGLELNVSSDIDLILLYGREGETNGRRTISNHEFYAKVVQRMMPILSEITVYGQVFRTDLRLRPDGDAGPLAWSLASFENYLLNQGREWERYAWIKARLIPAQAFAGSQAGPQVADLEALRIPFIYRKYFDFDALAALRSLRERIRDDWQTRALTRHGIEAQHNIKLGDGGIREIEFIVQLTQLIRGGRTPSIQQQSLLAALTSQKKAQIIEASVADRLAAAYTFLRRTEHRLQYREDEQTHLLPADPKLREQLAETLQLLPRQFEEELQQHRQFVHETFRDAFRVAGLAESQPEPARDVHSTSGKLLDEKTLQSHLGGAADQVASRIDEMLGSHRIRRLPVLSRQRLDALLPALIEAAGRTAAPTQTALRLLDLVEAIAPRSAYLALLAEYPETLARVSRIVGASQWAAHYLTRYPLLLDGLIEWQPLIESIDLDSQAVRLKAELDASLLPDGRPDIEQQMNLMRDLQRQISFQLLIQDLEGKLSVETLADYLSALADLLLEETLRRVWPLLTAKEAPGSLPQEPRFAIIAYGKLGGKELGYASDLDLVFIYDDPHENAAELYTRLGQRMVSWLSTLTSSGRLYDVDLRLRPDGDAGVLAVSLDAFRQYQLKHAWGWEHQALTRARFAAGDLRIGARFEALRRDILLLPRDPARLKADIRSMREKISAGHPNPTPDFDLKHDRGGMVDVEFITQYLVLCFSGACPVLLENLGNIALLGLAGQNGLLDPELAGAAADAYRTYRRRQHALRLDGAEKARVPADQLRAERDAVKQLWNTVLGD